MTAQTFRCCFFLLAASAAACATSGSKDAATSDTAALADGSASDVPGTTVDANGNVSPDGPRDAAAGAEVAVAVVPPFYTDKARLLFYLDGAGKEHAITTTADWALRRDHILAGMQLVMGPMPPATKVVPLDVQTSEVIKVGTVTRTKLTFAVETGDRVPAYLLVPDNLAGKAPAMLCLHQTTADGKGEPAGVSGLPNLHYALELAQRGYVTLAPDYPNYGDYTYDPYKNGYASTTMKGIWNHMRAIDLLVARAEVDPNRIGVIGHSLGGHNSIFVGVFDQRVRVTVSSCGFTSFPKYKGGDLTGWSHSGYMPRIATVYNKDPKKMPFDFTELVGALAPRALFVNAPIHDDNFDMSGVDDCIASGKPVFDLFKVGANLAVVHPDSMHDFPPESRTAAYAFIDKALKN